MPGELNAGRLAAAIGALALLASLFLDWYEPGFTAWDVFEVVDLLLAMVAIGALVAAAQDFVRRPWPLVDSDRWLPVLGAVALVLVVFVIADNPPAVRGQSEEAGAWIALGGALLMLLGAVAAQRRISVMISSAPRERPATGPAAQPTGPALEPQGSETETQPINPVGRP